MKGLFTRLLEKQAEDGMTRAVTFEAEVEKGMDGVVPGVEPFYRAHAGDAIRLTVGTPQDGKSVAKQVFTGKPAPTEKSAAPTSGAVSQLFRTLLRRRKYIRAGSETAADFVADRLRETTPAPIVKPRREKKKKPQIKL